jgi:hypothetical protein
VASIFDQELVGGCCAAHDLSFQAAAEGSPQPCLAAAACPPTHPQLPIRPDHCCRASCRRCISSATTACRSPGPSCCAACASQAAATTAAGGRALAPGSLGGLLLPASFRPLYYCNCKSAAAAVCSTAAPPYHPSRT